MVGPGWAESMANTLYSIHQSLVFFIGYGDQRILWLNITLYLNLLKN